MNTDAETAFPLRLRIARRLQKRGQEKLSRAAGLGRDAVWAYENRESGPTAHSLVALADELGVSCDWLLGRSDDPQSHRKGSL